MKNFSKGVMPCITVKNWSRLRHHTSDLTLSCSPSELVGSVQMKGPGGASQSCECRDPADLLGNCCFDAQRRDT